MDGLGLRDSWDLGYLRLSKRLVAEVGLIGAAVFARIAGYCDMNSCTCYASQGNIAKELGLSRITVNRYVKALCKAGYLEDQGAHDQAGTRTYVVVTYNDHKLMAR